MTINIDISPVEHEQEAFTLMLHHLKLAASYFEATPSPIESGEWLSTFSAPAILVWIQAMEGLYPKD